MLLFFLLLIVLVEFVVISLRFEFEMENFSYSNMLKVLSIIFCSLEPSKLNVFK